MLRPAAFCLVLLTVTACASTPEKEECTDDGQCRAGRVCEDGRCVDPDSVDPDMGDSSDAANNGANGVTNNANDDTFAPTTIALVKDVDADSSASVYYQDVRDCSGGFGWFEIFEGTATYRLQKGCGACVCDELPGCEPVGCPAVCAQPTVIELAAGESVTHEWPGYHWVNDDVDGMSCERKVAPTSDTLSVEFCWSRTEQDTGPGMLLRPVCETVEFDVGAERIEHRLQ